MRIDIKKTKVYPFNELSDEAKQTAIENLASINVIFAPMPLKDMAFSTIHTPGRCARRVYRIANFI